MFCVYKGRLVCPGQKGEKEESRDPFNDITALVSCTQRERAAGMMSLAGWLVVGTVQTGIFQLIPILLIATTDGWIAGYGRY